MKLAIELADVCKKRRNKTIGPLNMGLPEGYITALVGRNGSGKSTLMRMLMQLIHPDSGEIRWMNGAYPEGLPLSIRQNLAYVPEHPASEENHLTVNNAGAFRSRWYPSWNEGYFRELLDRFEVPVTVRMNKMSKGERRKFEIAAALAARPQLLLLDEPSSGLDPFAWKTMIEVLQRYIEETSATLLISTHIVEEIRRLADYIVLMHQGELLGMAEKDALFGLWHEVWIGAADEEELRELQAELPDGMDWRLETPGVGVYTTRNFAADEKRLADLGVQLIKNRSLELDEVLMLWTQGQSPALIDPRRGEK